ncbi:MAG: iron-sulfur cluster assembly scaffold protein [Candidatus Njordarchaeales archaeon]
MASRMPLRYSKKVIELFRNPVNMGPMEDADVVVVEGSPACGDMIAFYLKVRDNRIEKITFESYGCAANIAAASMLTMMTQGKTLEEAWRITWKELDEALGGLPKIKYHCSALAVGALKKAIRKYIEEHGIDAPWLPRKKVYEEEAVEEYYKEKEQLYQEILGSEKKTKESKKEE